MKLLSIFVIAFSIVFSSVAYTFPPDPELQSAIQTARQFANLKPRYTPSEITESCDR